MSVLPIHANTLEPVHRFVYRIINGHTMKIAYIENIVFENKLEILD